MKITIIIYKRLFILNPIIGGLQGEFGDLDIKYLKQNILKCWSHISGSFRKTSRHCAKWLRNFPGKCYKRIRICVIGKVETLSSPIWRQNSICETSGWNGGGSRIPDVDIQGGMSTAAGCNGGGRMEFLPGWNEL